MKTSLLCAMIVQCFGPSWAADLSEVVVTAVSAAGVLQISVACDTFGIDYLRGKCKFLKLS